MAPVDDSTVLGDFDDVELVYNGVTTTFFREDGKFVVRTDGPDGALEDFEVAYTFGVEPLQQYLVEFPDGRLQTLPVCWDSRPADEGGQRWFHIYPDEAVDHRDVLHWTGPLQNWNYMCAECHSTDLRKNYDLAANRYDTTWSEIDVSCEACHGPGSLHVARAEQEKAGNKPGGLVVSLADDGSWIFDPDAVTARREPPRTTRAQIETCARCHSRRTQLTDEYRHGQPLADTHRVALLDEHLYHADGQIKDEVYVYGSFLQSAMYREGVTCSDCHDPHTAELMLEGNATCVPCHKGNHFDTPEHHFHPVESTGGSCVACHMPQRTYMVVDPRRDHSFRVPRPELSVKLGTPNACNDCHTDRTAEWAAAAVSEWYGDERSNEPHYAEAIHAGRTWQPNAGRDLVAVVNDAEVPAIVRATALDLLKSFFSPEAAEAVRPALEDESPLVRAAAAETLVLLEPEARVRAGAPLLQDPVRTVRIAAARSLAEVPLDQPAPKLPGLDRGLREYADVQTFNADRATGRMNLGRMHMQQGRLGDAERTYRSAVDLEPAFAPAAVNLADLYRAQGRDGDGERVLRDALERTPEDADLHHALGLLLVRQKKYEPGVELLQRAAALAPDQPHYTYVYAVALHSTGDVAGALETLKRAHDRYPGHTDILLTLAIFYRDAGDEDAAARHARRLLELAPGHPGATALLAELGLRP
jgi:tetratricopeptide (TPR) repeat protein